MHLQLQYDGHVLTEEQVRDIVRQKGEVGEEEAEGREERVTFRVRGMEDTTAARYYYK